MRVIRIDQLLHQASFLREATNSAHNAVCECGLLKHIAMENFPPSAAEGERDFLRFILNTNVRQSTWLLKNLSRSQTDAVSEIFLNILHSDQLSSNLLDGVKQYRSLIRRVGDTSSGYIDRRTNISKHPRTVLKILLQFESILPLSSKDE